MVQPHDSLPWVCIRALLRVLRNQLGCRLNPSLTGAISSAEYETVTVSLAACRRYNEFCVMCLLALEPEAGCRVRFPHFHSQPNLLGLPRSAGHHLQRREHLSYPCRQAAKNQTRCVTAILSLEMSRKQCQGRCLLSFALILHRSGMPALRPWDFCGSYQTEGWTCCLQPRNLLSSGCVRTQHVREHVRLGDWDDCTYH